MATKKVVQELITKWKYIVEATEVRKTASEVKNLKKSFDQVRATSTSFGKGEFRRIRRIRDGWQGLNRQVKSYRTNLAKPVRTGVGMAGGNRGGGGRSGGNALSRALFLGAATGMPMLGSAIMAGGPIGALGLGLGAAIRTAGERQQQESRMKGLLGGGPEGGARAKQLLDDLNQFALQAPINVKDIRELSREALGGGYQQDEIVQTMQLLGDATQGNIVHLRRMLTNMVEIKNIGKASLRDVRQFGRVGIPIFEGLAKATGKSKEEIGDMITKGKIGLKEITKALKIMTGEGGRFFNAMKNQMDTLPGQLSLLNDAFTIFGEQVGEDWVPVATAAVENLKKALVDITPYVRRFSKGVIAIGKAAVATDGGIATLSIGVGLLIGKLMWAYKWFRRGTIFGLIAGAISLIIEDIGAFVNGDDSMLGRMFKWFKQIEKIGFLKSIAPELKYIKDRAVALYNWMKSTGIGRFFLGSAVPPKERTRFSGTESMLGTPPIPGAATGYMGSANFRQENNIYMNRGDSIESVVDDLEDRQFAMNKKIRRQMVG